MVFAQSDRPGYLTTWASRRVHGLGIATSTWLLWAYRTTFGQASLWGIDVLDFLLGLISSHSSIITLCIPIVVNLFE